MSTTQLNALVALATAPASIALAVGAFIVSRIVHHARIYWRGLNR